MFVGKYMYIFVDVCIWIHDVRNMWGSGLLKCNILRIFLFVCIGEQNKQM